MKIQILLFLFVLTLLVTNDVNAGKFSSFYRGGGGSRGGSSRSGSSRGGSRGGYSSGSSRSSGHGSTTGGHTTGSISHGSSSGGRTTNSRPFGQGSSPSGGHMTGSNSFGHEILSSGHMTGSSPVGHGISSSGHMTGSNPFGREILSSGHMTGSSPVGHGISSGQTLHQQNKDSSTSFLHAEGGGATRSSQTNPTYSSFGQPSVRPPYGNTGTYPVSQAGKPSVTMDNRQNSAPYNPYHPSAPSIDHLSKSAMVPSQSHAPTSFGQPNAPFNPSQGTVPHNNNPAWSNPHYNPNQPHSPIPGSTNIGIRNDLRPTPMPVPSHVPSAPYPHTSYPVSNSNQRPPPYPVHPSGYQPHSVGSQPQSSYNPSHFISTHPIGHPASYPAHVPPPVPGTFGNPYATHPVGSAYSSTGPSYYPQQQHVLAQPAAQPYIPGHTVIMVPGQQDSGRGFGQMVKEALVFSTINAGVNRLINPHHHYISESSRPAGSSTTTSETHITYNNHYFNGAPTGNAPAVPPLPSQGGSVNYPANYPSSASYPSPVNNPAITPGVSIPTIVGNNSSVVNPASGSLTGTTNMVGSPAVPPSGFAGDTTNNQGTSNQWPNMPQYRISDGELWTLTEELFEKQEFDVSKYLKLHLQKEVKSPNVTDEAKEPLFDVPSEVYEYPTIFAIRALYDNYEHNSTIKENRTDAKRKEEDLLLDVFLNTNVMARAMKWLSIRGFIDSDDFERKDTLRHIWFSQFDGATSGFERVFTSERYGYDLLGVQDWIYFAYQESKNRIDYKGYVETLKLGNNASLVKLHFQMDDIIRPNATIFVGTLPELEMSLYTICFFARPNDLCPVSLGGSKFNIYTHSFRYYGKDLIDLALPIF